MPIYPVEFNGKSVDIDAASPEEAARKAYTQFRLEQHRAPAEATETDTSLTLRTSEAAPEGLQGSTLAKVVRGAANVISPPFTIGERIAPGVTQNTQAFALRTAPGLVPNPFISAPLSAAGEAAAQIVEGKSEIDPAQVAIAGAMPLAVTGAIRGARALGRTATRFMPSLFEKAQGKAAEAGAEMVQGLRPTQNAAQLAQAARASGGDLVPAHDIVRVMDEIVLPATPANPRLEAVRTTIENLRGAIQPSAIKVGGKARVVPAIDLKGLEAIRRDIGPLLQSKAAPAELRGLYGAIVKDLESAAASGGTGATLAREAATAFKQDLGASKVGELIEKATTRRVISGADVPALNVATLMKLTRAPETRKQLLAQIGPDGVRVVDEFVRRFRTLPPDVAFNGWNRMVMTLGGGLGGAGVGAAVGGIPGAVAGALTPEVLTNMRAVGANPQQLNQVMVTIAQGLRATAAEDQR